jgi:L-amino acid N-acyltransferase YncA
MTADYDIAVARPDEIPGILALQEPNLPDNGGTLSVRQSADWFKQTMADMPLIVARRDGKVVGYMVAASLAAKTHVAIVQDMLRNYPASPGCYSYGPVCVAGSERGKGLAGLMFAVLREQLPGRSAMTFIRSDNAASLRAHEKMGLRILGEFENGGERYTALAYQP